MESSSGIMVLVQCSDIPSLARPSSMPAAIFAKVYNSLLQCLGLSP